MKRGVSRLASEGRRRDEVKGKSVRLLVKLEKLSRNSIDFVISPTLLRPRFTLL